MEDKTLLNIGADEKIVIRKDINGDWTVIHNHTNKLAGWIIQRNDGSYSFRNSSLKTDYLNPKALKTVAEKMEQLNNVIPE